MEIPNEIKFDEKGLVAAVIQDSASNAVLMLGYMNRESLEMTINSGRTWFWSRSRGKLWNKGETSGHFQEVKELFFDCDGDALLVKVDQIGAVCHTGHGSCFFNRIV
ncbi:MAG TPA: phosphoribosyl-AMP cyclohydrolase [Candidatus Margulisbacteria bacterium]|nr:phosphoribosyl-AMP cyclohydrolase [Candidatus Margulisiibacteriota bacterium]